MWPQGTIDSDVPRSPANKEYLNLLAGQGYNVNRTPGNHLAVTPTPERTKWLRTVGFDTDSMPSQVVFPSTPSDTRALANSLSDAARIGVNYLPPRWKDKSVPLADRLSEMLDVFQDGLTPSDASRYTGAKVAACRSALGSVAVANGRRKPLGLSQSQPVYVLQAPSRGDDEERNGHIDPPLPEYGEEPKSASQALGEAVRAAQKVREPYQAVHSAPAPEPRSPSVSVTVPSRGPQEAVKKPVEAPADPQTVSAADDLKELVDMIMDMRLIILEDTDCQRQLRRLARIVDVVR